MTSRPADAPDWPERDELLARFPLPDGIEEDTVNRRDLADALQVSENTISKWVTQGLPYLVQGMNGREWAFSLAECYAWRMARDDEQRARRERVSSSVQQMAMLFRNDGDTDPDEPIMSAKQIAEEADADYRRQRAAELRGELVRTERVRELLEDLLVNFRTGIETLPDWCEREFGLSPAQVEKLQGRCDAVLVESRMRIERETALRAPEGQVVPLAGEQEQLGV